MVDHHREGKEKKNFRGKGLLKESDRWVRVGKKGTCSPKNREGSLAVPGDRDGQGGEGERNGIRWQAEYRHRSN